MTEISESDEMERDHFKTLSSVQNPLVKQVVKLKDRRHRDELGLMVIEGCREIARALESGIRIDQLFICRELTKNEQAQGIIRQATQTGAEILEIDTRILEKIAYRENPDGLLAVARQPAWSLQNFRLGESPLVVIATGLEKPGNLGSILRSVDAAGGDGVVVCDGITDPANPNVIRASTGVLFTVQLAKTDPAETFSWLRENRIRVMAASPEGHCEFWDVDWRKPCAIAVGTEHAGLDKKWRENADQTVRIPMKGRADSLNVAVTTALLLFEAVRQRRE